MADIFLSYAKEDREKAERLAKALEGQGWSVFRDQDTPGGVSWREHIENELGQSRCVVAAWSRASIESEWVLEEAEDGKSRKVLIPVSLEADVRPPFGFRRVQAVDIAAWDGSTDDRNLQSLFKGLIRLLGDPPKKADVNRSKGAPTWAEDEKLNRRVLIEGGEFQMGSPEGIGQADERPRHPVRLSTFCLQEHPVTNEEYTRFQPGHGFPQGWERYPVVKVPWNQAVAYANWLGGRLPTEAEWEYACRAGTDTRYSSGNLAKDLDRAGWYKANSGPKTHPVSNKPANDWGLYDMHGNVREWVQDRYDPAEYARRARNLEPGQAANNPQGPSRGKNRVVRGGSFYEGPGNARSAYRAPQDPTRSGILVGFRVAFDATPSEDED